MLHGACASQVRLLSFALDSLKDLLALAARAALALAPPVPRELFVRLFAEAAACLRARAARSAAAGSGGGGGGGAAAAYDEADELADEELHEWEDDRFLSIAEATGEH